MALAEALARARARVRPAKTMGHAFCQPAPLNAGKWAKLCFGEPEYFVEYCFAQFAESDSVKANSIKELQPNAVKECHRIRS